MQILKRLVNETGAAAVVVTHDARIYEFADKICEMQNGRIETVGTFNQASSALPIAQDAPSEMGLPLCLPTSPYTQYEIGNSV